MKTAGEVLRAGDPAKIRDLRGQGRTPLRLASEFRISAWAVYAILTDRPWEHMESDVPRRSARRLPKKKPRRKPVKKPKPVAKVEVSPEAEKARAQPRISWFSDAKPYY